jgi:hypothetical protein
MKLNQALEIINAGKDSDSIGVHYLARGFEPLHLTTLLTARLLERLHTGVYRSSSFLQELSLFSLSQFRGAGQPLSRISHR